MFAKRSEQISPAQGNLLDDLIDTASPAIEAELKAASPSATPTELRQQPKCAALPSQFPRTVIHQEPENFMPGGALEIPALVPDDCLDVWKVT